MKVILRNSLLCLALTCAVTAAPAFAQSEMFEVTVTNLTRGQSMTPVFVTSHEPGIGLFTLGQPAGEGLVILAESGNTVPLEALVDLPIVTDTASSAGLLAPGASVTIMVLAHADSVVSVASMLIPTNDTFFAVNAAVVPEDGTLVVRSPGYDAGSEDNDELCENIPGPVCGGEGLSPTNGGEGYVHINSGIQGIGDLAPERDWRNPVAEISVRRVIQ